MKLWRALLAFALVLASATAARAADTVNVVLETSMGNVTLELYPDKAPLTVENFLRYADDGFYDGTVFHRVIYGFMIQGGGYTPDYQRKHTQDAIRNEADNGLKNERGTIAMARTSDPDSATSQFFINHANNSSLDFRSRDPQGWGYAVFGKVTQGLDVVDAIAMVDTKVTGPGMQNVPARPVIIERVTRLPSTK